MKTRSFYKRMQATVAIVAITASSILMPVASFAAAMQGTLGSTSTGSVDISVHKPAQAQITGLSDTGLTVANWTIATGALALSTTACVYSTGASAATVNNYSITVTGSNAADSSVAGFFLQASGDPTGTGPGAEIPYTVTWNDAVGSGGSAITDTVALASQTGDSLSTSCADGTGANAQLNVAITAPAMEAAGADTFTDTLTLLITPD